MIQTVLTLILPSETALRFTTARRQFTDIDMWLLTQGLFIYGG